MPDRGDDVAVGGAGRAQRATGSPCATPRSRPHRDGPGPCSRADRPARDRARDRAAAKPLITANSPTFLQPNIYSTALTTFARHTPPTDGSPPCFLSDISGWSLSLSGRRLLAAVADSVLANAGS